MTDLTKTVRFDMPVAAWIAMQDNPRQRDTRLHAKSIEPALKKFSPTHVEVAAAQLPDGTLIKLDGHTRALLWHEKRIYVPAMVHVTAFPAKDMEEVKDLYEKFDNSLAVETKAHRVTGAFREHGIHPSSKLLKRGTLSYALGIAHYAETGMTVSKNKYEKDIYALVQEWRNEILVLDKIIAGHQSRRLHSAILAAMLVTIRKHGYAVVAPFWGKYLEFTPSGDIHDPHNVLLNHLRERQLKRQTNGRENAIDIASKALAALEHSLIGNRPTKLYGLKFVDYLSTPSSDVTKRIKRTQTKSVSSEMQVGV